MKIRVGDVKGNGDLLKLGGLRVECEAGGEVWVKYTTPYLAGRSGGMIAIPEIGSKVLICQPDNSDDWYYMSSITYPSVGEAFGEGYESLPPQNKEQALFDPQIYKARGVPQRVVMSSAKGNKLTLSDEYAPDYANVYAKLESGSGKCLVISDSPDIDSIILRNEEGDRIKISMKGNGTSSPRSIEIESQGPINILSRESNINLHVKDGKEINILNESTGSKRVGLNDPTPGNINITSKYADVNVTTNSKNGVIRLEAQGSDGHVVIDSQGTVQINGEKGVAITSGGDIVVDGDRVFLNPSKA